MTSDAPRRPWARWLIPILTVGLLAIFARGVDWTRAWTAVANANLPLLAVAVVANLVSLLVKGVRWWLFLSAAGVTPLGEAVRVTVAGAALNNVVVAQGGDAARVAAIARRSKVSSAAVLATLVVDRFCDLAIYAVMFVSAAFLLPLPPELARWRAVGVLGLAILAAIAAALVRRAPREDRAVTPASTVRDSTFTRAQRYLRRLATTTVSVTTGARLAAALALSCVAWAGQWATFHVAALAVAFPVSASDSLLALLAVNASFAVRLTPGNVGVFQVLYALAATARGLDRADAIAVAFLIQLIQYIPVTLVGLALAPSLARRDARAGSQPRNGTGSAEPEWAMRSRAERERT